MHETTLRAKLALADSHAAAGQPEIALPLAEEVLAARLQQLGAGHAATQQATFSVVMLNRKLGRLPRATELMEQLVRQLQVTAGPRHTATLAMMVVLASIHLDQAQYGPAIALREAVLQVRTEIEGATHADTLRAMESLAAAHYLAGHYEKALPLQEKLLAARRTTLGEAHVDTLEAMSELASTHEALGRYGESVPLQRRVYEGLSNQLGPTHADTVRAMSNLATGLTEANQLKEALDLANTVYHLRLDQLGARHPSTLFSLNSYGHILNLSGLHELALPRTQESLQLHREVLGKSHRRTASALTEHATSLTKNGQLEEALALREEACRVRQAALGDTHPDTLSACGNLAAHHLLMGRADKAIPLLEASLPLMRGHWGPSKPNTLITMGHLAAAYGAIGQHDKALRLQEQAVALWSTTQAPEHPDAVHAQANLSLRLAAVGRYAQALEVGRKALDLRRARLGEAHPESLHLLHNQAVLHRSLGQHKEALTLGNEAFFGRAALLGESHPDTLMSMRLVALVLADLNLHDQAAAKQERALHLMRGRLGNESAETLGLMHELSDSHYGNGQLDKAVALVPVVVARAESMRTQADLTQEQRRSMFEAFADRYQIHAARLAEAGRLVEAFDLGDQSKARSLTDNIRAQTALRLLPMNEQTSIAQAESVARGLAARMDRLMASDNRDTAAVRALQRELEAVRAAHRENLARLSRQYPRYAQSTTPTPVSSRDAGRWLGKGEVFISYLVQGRGNFQVFVLDASGQPRWVDMKPLANLAQSVAAYRELLASSAGQSARGQLVALRGGGYEWLLPGAPVPEGAIVTATKAEEARKVLEQHWHDALIKPVLPLAGAYRRWIVSPDKELALLPFDTIPDGNEQDASPRALVQTRQISLVQSFSVHALLKEREAEYARTPYRKTLLAMGNPVYSDGWSSGQGMARAQGQRGYSGSELVTHRQAANGRIRFDAAAELEAMQRFHWENLPGTARELRAVEQTFTSQGNRAVEVMEGGRASEAGLQELNARGQLRDYRYLLFSAHGYLADNPEHSALVLSRQGNPQGVDGYITAAEWPTYDLRSELIVLSACDTAVGRAQAGESVLGLPYALFVAGNRNALLTLWPVDDEATAEFISRFFSKVRSGVPQLEALSRTKREFTVHPRWHAPMFWAAFVLYGV